ncbi:5-hydroxytryptamine receptor 3A-like [Mixophyes fleayi]|uniref:5-hydroxytryptamine receptor 3A-like n=1 Tax=Mixophyes fleayi TaxID=3061075 RepID=UPI003F4DE7B8
MGLKILQRHPQIKQCFSWFDGYSMTRVDELVENLADVVKVLGDEKQGGEVLYGYDIEASVIYTETEESDVKFKPNLIRLADYLMDGYNKGVRPVQDWRQPTTVQIDITIYAILGVDEKNQVLTTYIWYNQSWVDEFLTWDPKKFDNVTLISIPTPWVWVPDIMVIEFVDVGKSPEVGYVYLNHKGGIINNKPIQIVSSCSLDIYYFPFDHQNCSLTFTSWIHTTEDINITFWRSAAEMTDFLNVYVNEGEWDLLNVIPSYRVFHDHNYSFGEIKFFIIIRRRPLFYTVNLIMPSMFLMIMDIAGFYLPPESGERVSFKITLLLGYSVFLIIVSDKLPAAGAPLIGVYFIVCMVLLVINLAESIFIVRIVHQQNLHPEVPKWVKTFVLEKMAALLCLKQSAQFGASCNDISKQMESSSTVMSCNNENVQDCSKQLAVTQDSDVMLCILKEIVSIRECVQQRDVEHITKEWLQVGYIMDKFLFRAYLIALLMYAVSMTTVWAQSRYI